MLRVTKIVGEGFDLENGSKVPPGIIVSNGKSDLLITLPDDENIRQSLVQMWVEETQMKQQAEETNIAEEWSGGNPISIVKAEAPQEETEFDRPPPQSLRQADIFEDTPQKKLVNPEAAYVEASSGVASI